MQLKNLPYVPFWLHDDYRLLLRLPGPMTCPTVSSVGQPANSACLLLSARTHATVLG